MIEYRIRQIENGYLVTYPKESKGVSYIHTYYCATFEAALKFLKDAHKV